MGDYDELIWADVIIYWLMKWWRHWRKLSVNKKMNVTNITRWKGVKEHTFEWLQKEILNDQCTNSIKIFIRTMGVTYIKLKVRSLMPNINQLRLSSVRRTTTERKYNSLSYLIDNKNESTPVIVSLFFFSRIQKYRDKNKWKFIH